jgi:flagellar basal body-associated protein FliL
MANLARAGHSIRALLIAMSLAFASLIAPPLQNQAFASEGGAETAEPIVMMIQFVRTERGRLKIWAMQFRIDAPKETLTQIGDRQPRIIDGVIVRMTTGKDAELRPTIEEVKKAITETIEERLGTVVGLEITVMKLKQVG